MFGRFTYLVFEVGWGVPVLAVQWAFGWRALWLHREAVVLALTLVTVYLSVVDGVAIVNGIWTLHRDRIIQVYLGPVPVEESLFFLLTNAMVAQSVVLLAEKRPVPFRRPFSTNGSKRS